MQRHTPRRIGAGGRLLVYLLGALAVALGPAVFAAAEAQATDQTEHGASAASGWSSPIPYLNPLGERSRYTAADYTPNAHEALTYVDGSNFEVPRFVAGELWHLQAPARPVRADRRTPTRGYSPTSRPSAASRFIAGATNGSSTSSIPPATIGGATPRE